MSQQDLHKLNTTYDEINYYSKNTKNVITEILSQAKTITGFNYVGKTLLIEILPHKENGCIIYFSSIQNYKNHFQLKKSIFRKYSFEYLNIEDLIISSILLFERHGYKIFKSSLYINKKSKKYFLTLSIISSEDKEIISLLKEFAKQKIKGPLFQSLIDEHYKIIIKNNAIEVIYNNFK